ncbi:MAG TPA: hypothetical protein VMU03_10630 [Gammaproteobacteria bacterium]|jgi:hypothetical protein|nr:hypothetical protein [Gammaproteobacteria bacterium]
MPDGARFEALRLELQRGGIAKVYVERTLRELADHFDDLERAALASGSSSEEARQLAHAQLGNERVIASAVLARPELMCWSRRWPTVALCVRSAAAIGVLPALPVLYVAGRSDDIARWGGAIGAALVLVGSLYSVLGWMIMVE